MIEFSTRQLTADEKAEYREWLNDLRRPVRPLPRTALLMTCVIGAVVGVAVGAVSKGPPTRRGALGVLALSVCAGMGTLYARELSSELRRRREQIRAVEQAVVLDRVEVLRLRATEVVAFEEIGDLGPYCAFQVQPDLIMCLGGQAYIDLQSFPSEETEITCLPLVDARIACSGRRLQPLRIIPAAVHKHWTGPRDRQRLHGSLNHLEGLLAEPSEI
jgi:hypothetical protein